MTSTGKPDYWSLLGLDPDSDQNELKRAFRREARKWHPDLNGNNIQAEERFKLVNEAYAVLSDPRKRSDWEKEGRNIEYSDDPFVSGFPTFEDYSDVVLGLNLNSKKNVRKDENIDTSEKFQWPTTSAAPPPPVQIYDDIETIVELTPQQALYGTTVELELNDGTIVEVVTPQFAGDGWKLRLAGVAKGGRDHFLQLRVQTEDGLRIDGLRVLYKLELFPPDCLLGCAVDIPTITGKVTLQVPPRSSSGRLLRLRGRGLEFDGQRGDQIVEIVIVIPANVTDSELALYKRLQELALQEEL